METIIKVHPSELNSSLLNKIHHFISDKQNIDITISLKEFDPLFADDLNRSINEAEANDVISFTMEKFISYKPQPKK